jgi:hypothetical protein
VQKVLYGKICHITNDRGNNLGADLDVRVRQRKFRK